MSSPADNSSGKNSQVDAAFERCFGYRWGERLDDNKTTVLQQQLSEVFGSRLTAMRVLRLYESSNRSVGGQQKRSLEDNSLSVLNRMTKRIKSTTTATSETKSFQTLTKNSKSSIYKKQSISQADYMNLPLPASVVAANKRHNPQQQAIDVDGAATSSNSVPASGSKPSSVSSKSNGGRSTSTAAVAGKSQPKKHGNSNLDNVLKQLAGPKKMNTVEKTSGDWEGFKANDKQLQDELEQAAQGKDAFLVKQDFLERVDQRRFEIEKDERDQERARRQLASAGSKK